MRRALVMVGLLISLSLLGQLIIVTIVNPLELNNALHHGCKVFNHITGKKPLTLDEQGNLFGAFTKAAWLDPKYLNLVQASALYTPDASKLTSAAVVENYKAATLLIGFCYLEK